MTVKLIQKKGTSWSTGGKKKHWRTMRVSISIGSIKTAFTFTVNHMNVTAEGKQK